MELEIGKDAPGEVNAFIEIPKGSNIKYELDEASGLMKVDRVLHTAMFYPFNYGFIAGTKGEDGDPLDVMVISNAPFRHRNLRHGQADRPPSDEGRGGD